ncbi:UNVERIFIED_ORG: glycosyl transferase family 2 [Zoogloea ramigera]|uniref:Glycosyltransferase family 2 protein n=1 Tax=Duganella zoogloeoides TaxID=75659 RepID=A0ABZ0Y0J5_9BURK|nr:glycosyltransferase family 2 protein [Duganella zoogloeoides]WQH05376.1 glycosyltransferase family 2 protein [Duganella zoogloeoides]
MNAPLRLSIVVPAYNVQDFIVETLDCILPQMRDGHELVLIDDGSTDATVERARGVFAAWPQCAARIVQQTNAGVADARNNGVAQARGDYILFVDSDDLLQPGALDGIDAAIAQYAPDVIATDFCIWYPGRTAKPLEYHHLGYPPNVVLEGPEAILSTYFADRHMYVWCKIIRRDIYLQLGLPLFPSGRLFEDMAIVPRLLAACRTLVYVPLVLLHYRQHPVSITRVITPQWCTDFVLALASARPYLESAGATDSAAMRAEFDGAATLFYLCAIKTSFQLPASAQPDQVRAEVRKIYLGSLFGTVEKTLHNLEAGQLASVTLRNGRRCARQVRQALADSTVFKWRQTINRAYKTWQMARQQRLSKTN